MVRAGRPVLKLIRERKLVELIPPPQRGAVLEASGVVVRGSECFVVFDNVRQMARVGIDLDPASRANAWLGRRRAGEGYEDVAYSPHLRRFFLLIEAEKHPDGTYKAVIEECDAAWRYQGRAWADFAFETRQTGFEGLIALRVRGADYLLALCEGNRGLHGARGRTPGGGQIVVFEKKGRGWSRAGLISLPYHLDFEDYSAMALRGRRLAVVSQKSARLWVGTLRTRDWSIAGDGCIYEFPRTSNGKRLYCTIEGLDWRSADSFVMVSDLRKPGYPDRCARTDQSIHIFRLPRSTS